MEAPLCNVQQRAGHLQSETERFLCGSRLLFAEQVASLQVIW